MSFWKKLFGGQTESPLKMAILLNFGTNELSLAEGAKVIKCIVSSPDYRDHAVIKMVQSVFDSHVPYQLQLGTIRPQPGIVGGITIGGGDLGTQFIISYPDTGDNFSRSEVKEVVLNMVRNTWNLPSGKLEYFPAKIDKEQYVCCLVVEESLNDQSYTALAEPYARLREKCLHEIR